MSERTKLVATSRSEPRSVPASVRSVLSTAGAPLEPSLTSETGRLFGHDLSGVRVHAGDRASQAARSVGARAFTVGSHIVFGQDAFQPGSVEGRSILTHELAHVVQQAHASSVAEEIGAGDSALEKEAEDWAKQPHRATSSLQGAQRVPHIQRYEAGEHALIGDLGPAALTRVVSYLSEAEARLRANESAWTELVQARRVWEEQGGDPAALRELETATRHNDEGNLPQALRSLEAAFPRVMNWLRQHPPSAAQRSTRIGRRDHPEAAELLSTAGSAPELVLRQSGVRVTYGEVVALGDFYPTVEAMNGAPREELVNRGRGILDLIRAEVGGRSGVNFDLEYQRATQGRDVMRYDRLGRSVGREGALRMGEQPQRALSFIELARTDVHFADLNRGEWERRHAEAIRIAGEAHAQQSPEARAQKTMLAYMTNAFADHFLTDAFAAGHLFNRRTFISRARAFLASNRDAVLEHVAAAMLNDHRGAIFNLVSMGVRTAPIVGQIPVLGVLAGWLVGGLAWLGSFIAPGLTRNMIKNKILGIERKRPGALADAMSKVVHDELNTTGVQVTNQLGDRWRTFGDKNLQRSPITWQLASLAVLRSRADVAQSLRGTPPTDPLAAWQYTPVPDQAFDPLDIARRLIMRNSNNRMADLFVQNTELVELMKRFDDREEGRAGEARDKQERAQRYLAYIRRTGRIEDRSDSDDIARDIVGTPEMYGTLTLREKALLVQEMQSGFTGDDDERAILAILRDLQLRGQLRELLRLVPADSLRSDFHGSERRELEAILASLERTAFIPDADLARELGYELDPGSRPSPAPHQPSAPPPPPGQPAPPPPPPPAPALWDGRAGAPGDAAARMAMQAELFNAFDAYLRFKRANTVGALARPRVPFNTPLPVGTAHVFAPSGVVDIANQARAVLEVRYRTNMDAAAPSVEMTEGCAPRSATPGPGQNIFDVASEADRSTLTGEPDLAPGVAWWLFEHDVPGAAGAPGSRRFASEIRDSHHYQGGTPDADQFRWDVAHAYAAASTLTPNNRRQLIDYRMADWSERGTRGITVQSRFDPGGNRNRAELQQRWSVFETAVHESLHLRTHPAFRAADRQRGTMIEGFTEMFSTATLNTDVLPRLRSGSLEPLRRTVEGALSTPSPDAALLHDVSTPTQYIPDRAAAERIRDGGTAPGGRWHAGVGETAVRAAYFQGHVEYIGLDPTGAQLTGLRAAGDFIRVRVPPGIGGLADLSARIGVPRSSIVANNPGIGDALPPTAVLEGCREHRVVSGETRALIAQQYGLPELSLTRANPDIATGVTGQWPVLTTGQRILIPVR